MSGEWLGSEAEQLVSDREWYRAVPKAALSENPLIPAKAGIAIVWQRHAPRNPIPAFAGMSGEERPGYAASPAGGNWNTALAAGFARNSFG